MLYDNSKANYSIGKSKMIVNLISVALISFVIAMLNLKYNNSKYELISYFFGVVAFLAAYGSFKIINFALWGKYKYRDKIVSLIKCNDDEQILDVGIGKGLISIGIAKTLKTGKITGVDIWNTGNMLSRIEYYIRKNIEIEGVKRKIKIRTQNAIALQFNDNTFDVVVSDSCIHNLYNDDERKKAIYEMIRVLKPNGKLIIGDIKYVNKYKNLLEMNGFNVTFENLNPLYTYPFLKLIKATKEEKNCSKKSC